MSDSVGQTTFHDLNLSLLDGDLKVGQTASDVDNTYRSGTASFGKRLILGILTLGGYAIYQKYLDSRHASDLAKLSRGTEDIYRKLTDLTRADPGTEVSVTMCGERAKLSKDAGGQYFVTFADKERHAISDPRMVLRQIEQDVMAHSELFEKSLVVDGILGGYEQRIDAGPQHDTNDLRHELEDLDHAAAGIFHENQEVAGQALGEAYRHGMAARPALAAAKTRYDELIATLFSSRLGLSQDETQYIDRALGRRLAAAVMDGSLSTAADARAFINRNAAATHFTTMQASAIYADFERMAEKEAGDAPLRRGEVSTQTVSFRQGYYEPAPNAALPAGKAKQIHEFVADIISESNVFHHEAEMAAGGQSDGRRLRALFEKNRALVAELMDNRARSLKDPAVPSLLSTLEPGIRAAVEEQLDALNERYDAALSARMAALDAARDTLETARAAGESRGYLATLQGELNEQQSAYDIYSAQDNHEGRQNFLRDELSKQHKQENGLRRALGTADIDDVSNEELDEIGSSRQGQKSDVVREMRGRYRFLSQGRNEIGLGLNFFGEMEKRLEARVRTGCEQLQQEVAQMVASVFPPAHEAVKMSTAQIELASLDEIRGPASADPQLQLVRTALTKYFTGMPPADQRAMLAAGTRWCVYDGHMTPGARLGAILKGAGPVMQKMLQGLDPAAFSASPDFQTALSDLKARLAPIPEEVVHAALYDVVKNSGGAIRSIEVTGTLGAASVAQVFRCRVTMGDRSVRECAVKVVRPEAQLRAERERMVFEAAASEVGNGMQRTFRGRYRTIMQEMDLRREAENLTRGNEVYNCSKSAYTTAKVAQTYGSFANVGSVKLAEGAAPAAGALVLELVPGQTLESYLEDSGSESRRVADEAREQISARGPENAPQIARDAARQLTRLYDDVKARYEALVNLAYMWTNEGLFAEGFYHGDIHMGNLMTVPGWKQPEAAQGADSGITLIDYGNATGLSQPRRAAVIKVMAGAAASGAKLFSEGFRELLPEASRAVFDAAAPALIPRLKAVFSKGSLNDTPLRISAALALIQRELKLEVPGAIHNFLESQKRLQTALSETLATMNAIAAERTGLLSPYLDSLPAEDQEELRHVLNQARNYRPVTMVKCLSDVIRQNLVAAVRSIGSPRRARICYERIMQELPAGEQLEA